MNITNQASLCQWWATFHFTLYPPVQSTRAASRPKQLPPHRHRCNRRHHPQRPPTPAPQLPRRSRPPPPPRRLHPRRRPLGPLVAESPGGLQVCPCAAFWLLLSGLCALSTRVAGAAHHTTPTLAHFEARATQSCPSSPRTPCSYCPAGILCLQARQGLAAQRRIRPAGGCSQGPGGGPATHSS